jgi:diguanylate cyclase (GGDEF)-like protein
MESWTEISDRLRARYVVATAWTLDRLTGLIDRLAEHPSGRQAREMLVELRRCFRGLAGSGGSYGFAELTAAALEGERSCSALLGARRLPAGSDLVPWRDLVRRMGAELTAAAPPRVETVPVEEERPPKPSSDAGDRSRVLYVEDSPVQAAYIRSVLEPAGYLVRCCAHPHRFMAELEAFDPALVLMDCLLPGVTGYELVRSLRLEERFAALPVLFLTTEDRVQARIETARAGGDDHLIKPVAPKLLLAAVQARLERSDKLNDLLTRDGLTRLLTQTAFADRARQLADRYRQDPRRRVTWVMIDLDRFKSINDRFGHPVGDRVLAAAATHLSRHRRDRDSVGRCGGEEFAVLLDGPSETEALGLIERLREGFASLEHDGGGGIPFCATFSAGIAMLQPGMSVEQWRAAADLALYAAKAAGRNCVEVAGRAPTGRGETATSEAALLEPVVH